ncbi:MAG: hypothetical protein ACFB9M_00705 [Myxococcota bacterium]
MRAEEKPAPPAKAVTSRDRVESLNPRDEDLADLAVDVLTKELDVPRERIRVEAIRPVEWPDTSLGCPEPGQIYGQVITPGHEISLKVGEARYVVHEAGGRAILCTPTQKDRRTSPEPTSLAWSKQALEARADLASRLGVEEEAIKVASARPRTWPDRSLGCPGAEPNGPAEEVSGYELVLKHRGRVFIYHTDLERVIPCPGTAED